jgi:hypothetical protein
MAEESGSDFWQFAEALRANADVLDRAEAEAYSEPTHEAIASLAVEVASGMLSPLQLSALRLTLSVRAFAPLVEAHRSLAAISAHACNGAPSWAILKEGRVACTPDDLAAAAASAAWPTVTSDPAAEAPNAIDHAWPGDAAAGALSVVLYGRLGTSPFWAFHDALVALQARGVVGKYVFRHGIPPAAACTVTTLQGYGVNLDIKNMEYMNLDERKGEAAAAVAFPAGEEVGGFVFSTLLERRPDLGAGLASFRSALLAASDELQVNLRQGALVRCRSVQTSACPPLSLIDATQP